MSASLGVAEPDELDIMLVNLMEKVVNEETWEPGEGVLHHEEGVDCGRQRFDSSGIGISVGEGTAAADQDHRTD